MWKIFDLTTWVRAFLAIGVIWITFDLARHEPLPATPAGAAASLEAPSSGGEGLASTPSPATRGTPSPGSAAMTVQPPGPAATPARSRSVVSQAAKDRNKKESQKESQIPKEWEAIFVLVVAFYFSDRPQVAALIAQQVAPAPVTSSSTAKAAAEVGLQFLLGLLLIVLTVGLFTIPGKEGFRSVVDGAWIAGVALAVGFYFKKTNTPLDDEILPILRATLALATIAASLVMCCVRGGRDIPIIPLQWISLVFIVVAFYFKERDA